MRIGGVLFLLAISVASVRAASPEAIKEVAAELVCLCGDCARESLATCLCGFATQQREDIGSSLDGGKTAQETIDEYVSEYGQMVLASPPAEGINLLAWITPFAALVFGVFSSAPYCAIECKRCRQRPQSRRPSAIAYSAI